LEAVAKSIQCIQKHTKLIKKRFNGQKLIKIQLTRLECGNFSQGAGTPGTERDIALSQLTVKELKRKGM
jgi:hypothetical protein